MKAIFFTKYSRKGASSRLRTFQFLDYYEANGVKCTIAPFFSDSHLTNVYEKKLHSKMQYIKSFFRRLAQLVSIFSYDRVIIEKELFPYFPAIAEWILNKAGVRYVVDYDDAIFHNYDQSTNPLIRSLLSRKIDRVMQYAEVVVAGNDYLAQRARKAGAQRVVIIPTVIDMEKYRVKQHVEQGFVTIGWIGSPITSKYLPFLKPVFTTLAGQWPVKVVLVGLTRPIGLGEFEQVVPWSEDTEAGLIEQFDIGIMPLEDNIWERGKCGYKLIQYLGCGIPVVGTPLGANDVIIDEGVNGFKATTSAEWVSALGKLISMSAKQREEMGVAGRDKIEDSYSLQAFRPVWLQILRGEYETER